MKLTVSSQKVINNKICELQLALHKKDAVSDKRQQIIGAMQALKYLRDLHNLSAKTAYTGSTESIFTLMIDANTLDKSY